jgi:hypothetical protein
MESRPSGFHAGGHHSLEATPHPVGRKHRLRSASVGSKNVLAVKVGVARDDHIGAKDENRDRIMLNFAHVFHRTSPLASLGLGLSLVVAWGAIWYGLLMLLW